MGNANDLGRSDQIHRESIVASCVTGVELNATMLRREIRRIGCS